MNIQFMTAEKNGVKTGRTNWKGEEKYKYIPDYDELIKNATCQEEIYAINDAIGIAFTFEIVFTVKTTNGWQIYQFPWYEDVNGKYTESKMLDEINAVINTL